MKGRGHQLATPTPPPRLPIGDLDPSTEAVDVLYGYRGPRWRGRGRRLAAPIPNQDEEGISYKENRKGKRGRGRRLPPIGNLDPPPRPLASSVGVDDLGGGVKAAETVISFRFSL
ncbi:hypothetical protein CRG98_032110 [Punica granatum]|uniref:Uncharacterized protein n=1 Tax=Punica granatum TaxID=22663 RepID=A0A2I0IV29_PUNGR|nr:hypothetical protein CRG98_032110 [Punica granatum]